jgi:hypothetical protein
MPHPNDNDGGEFLVHSEVIFGALLNVLHNIPLFAVEAGFDVQNVAVITILIKHFKLDTCHNIVRKA